MSRAVVTGIDVAETFIGIAQAALARALHEGQATAAFLELEGPSGEPVLAMVTDHLDGATALEYLAAGYRDDRLRAHARETLAPALSSALLGRRDARLHAAERGCRDATCRHSVVIPLTGVGHPLGTLWLGSEQPLPDRTAEVVTALCAQVAVRLAHLGFHDRAGREVLARLTDRQREVARLVSRGLTNAEIAHQLGVTEDAIKKHLKVMMAALDVANRAELAVLAARGLTALDHLEGTRVAPGFRLLRGRALDAGDPSSTEERVSWST